MVWEAPGSKVIWLQVGLEVERLGVQLEGGSVNRKLRTTTSIKANCGSLALMKFFGLWKHFEGVLNPRKIGRAHV